VLSRAGVTGAETQAQMPGNELIASLANHQAPPSVLGFGISKPEQVRDALAAGASGAISGSAVVKIIEANLGDDRAMITALSDFIREMKSATRA